MSSKRDVSDEQNERHKKILDRLLKEDGNKFCVDCGMRSPTWASVNLGVFMCMTCSGIHRSLGVHISQVRSTKLDTWLPKQVEFIQRMGNIKGNKYWEAELPTGYRRPPGVAPNPELQKFIRDKYCEARYAAKDVPAPNINNYTSHPYIISDVNEQQPEPAKPATAVKPIVNIPLPTKPSQPVVSPPQSGTATPAASSRPSSQSQIPAQPAVDFDLLCMDAVPASTPAAPTPADDPFAAITAAPVLSSIVPATATSNSAGNDPFAAFPDSGFADSAFPQEEVPAAPVATPTPTAAPASKPAPPKSSDPFATLVGDDLISNMKQVSIQPKADPANNINSFKAAAPPASKTAADILKLYDTPQSNSFNDPFLGPVAGDPANLGTFGSGQMGSGQFAANQTIPAVGGMYGGVGMPAGGYPVQNAPLYPPYAGATPQVPGAFGMQPGMQPQVQMYAQQMFAPGQFGAMPTAGNQQFNSFF